MNLILNIGLMAPDGTEIAATAALRAMRAASIVWATARQHQSSTENTLVVECDTTDDRVDLVACWLEQDCIAVWDRMHREGRMIGPRAAKWGEFDPSQFLLPNGSRLSEARPL